MADHLASSSHCPYKAAATAVALQLQWGGLSPKVETEADDGTIAFLLGCLIDAPDHGDVHRHHHTIDGH
jgi:hypothetical protein